MNRAVIFDSGGVLFKTRDYEPRLRWDHRLGLEPGSVERVVHGIDAWRAAQTGQILLEAYWQEVASTLDLDLETTVTTLAHDFYSGDSLDAAIIDYIRSLRANDYQVAMLSNDHAQLLHPRLTQHGIIDLFDPLVVSSEIGVMKPDPAAFEAVLARLGRPGSETIFIDDMMVNVQGARHLGIRGILYTDGMNLPQAITPLLKMQS